MNKIFRILEIFWMAMGGVGIILASYFLIVGDSQNAVFFLIFTLVSGIIYMIRKRQRKKFEAALAKEKK